MPEVSVILPTYNRLPLLRQAIASVQAQQFGNWELIVVDDGSTDGTGGFVEGLEEPRCRLVSLHHGGNVARARNAGIAVARGRYVAFLDSDDLWLPGKLAAQLAAMRNTQVRWSYTACAFIDGAGNEVARRAGRWTPLAGRIVEQVLSLEADVCIQSVLVERGLLDQVGHFNEDPALILREDYELLLRLAAAAPVGVVDEPLVQVREHAGRSTRTARDPFERTAHAYRLFAAACANPGLARLARRRLAYSLAEAGAYRLRRGEPRLAFRSYMQAARAGDSIGHLLSALWRGVTGALAGLVRGRQPER